MKNHQSIKAKVQQLKFTDLPNCLLIVTNSGECDQ